MSVIIYGASFPTCANNDELFRRNCDNVLAPRTKGNLCGNCYRNRNNLSNTQLSQEQENESILGISEDQIERLPDLPSNWIDEPHQNLSGGHLLKIMLKANSLLMTKLNDVDSVINKLNDKIESHKLIIDKHEDIINENSKKINRQDDEIEKLKRVILNQQTFIENSQRKLLAKNCVISGIPNDDIVWGDRTYIQDREKIDAVLKAIDIQLPNENYEIKIFNTNADKPTFTAKLLLTDYNVKKSIMDNASNLRICDCVQLKKVFIKHDETKLASKENYRLRQKKRTLKAQLPDADLKIEKGKLMQDGSEIDKFDLNNQIFC